MNFENLEPEKWTIQKANKAVKTWSGGSEKLKHQNKKNPKVRKIKWAVAANQNSDCRKQVPLWDVLVSL